MSHIAGILRNLLDDDMDDKATIRLYLTYIKLRDRQRGHAIGIVLTLTAQLMLP